VGASNRAISDRVNCRNIAISLIISIRAENLYLRVLSVIAWLRQL